MNYIKSNAKKFIKKNGVTVPLDWKQIEYVARKNKWLLVPYSRAEKFIESYGLNEKIKERRAIAYKCKNEIVLMYRDGLDESEKIGVVCHEIGHISMDHVLVPSEITVEQAEYEANEFADILLKRNKKALTIIIASAVLAILSCIIVYFSFGNINESVLVNSVETERSTIISEQRKVYISKSGHKYHRADCYQIDIDKCTVVTPEQAQKMGYEPCSTCKPDDRKGY